MAGVSVTTEQALRAEVRELRDAITIALSLLEVDDVEEAIACLETALEDEA